MASRSSHFLAIGALAGALSCTVGTGQEPRPETQPKIENPPAVKPTNRLADENSPYLRQHAHNPVDWYPWGDEAFALARREDKPIFLSIGYAACHWCHVMEHESFENEAIAAVMNRYFVCIKVDREERPDVDEIYMAAVQAMGVPGGWPLSVWLTPAGKPFHGGTYFPPDDRYGRPGFRRVLEHMHKVWVERRDEVEKSAAGIAGHLQQVLAPELAPGEPTAALLESFLPQSRERYDPDFGGFAPPPNHAPKFPHCSELTVLMRLGRSEGLVMVEETLTRMRAGGIYDQLGGGFHRYSVDREWLVPHFEKMLYDNAQLVPVYLELAARTGDTDFTRVATETLDYLLREMQHPRGGFFSSQDADSEGVEGKFFVWQQAEFEALLGDDAALAERAYGVTAAGNWEHSNILVRGASASELAAEFGAAAERLPALRARLLAARNERVHPGTDDKILCAWNGLAIAAFAVGYRATGELRYLEAAQRAADFALGELVEDGRCRRSWHSDNARHDGVLEDYAMLADGLLALFECDSDARWLAAAKTLLDNVDAHFGAADGGFWFTADDAETLVARTKIATESSTPSGMAVAARAFLRAGTLLGDERLYDRGVAVLRYNHGLLASSPVAAPALLLAVQFHLAEPREVVVAGEPDDPRTRALLAAAWRAFPDHHVVANVHAGNRAALAAISPLFADRLPVDGVPAAYVCRRGACERPLTDPAALRLYP
ncbi:MAG: thioredoxin domain-containing protein [Planctomycetes bacterium]|nr:thioredoxin domain-containing protein [Planctomycetota bacterium]